MGVGTLRGPVQGSARSPSRTTFLFPLRRVDPSSEELGTDLGLLTLSVIWGVNFSVLKAVLDVLDPLALNALRFPLAGLVLIPLVRRQPGPRRPERSDVAALVALGLLGNVVYQLCFIYGLNATLAGNASLLLATSPVWTLLLSLRLGHERASLRVVAGLLATVAGMVLVVLGRVDRIGLGLASLKGDMLMVTAAVLWSGYTVGARGHVRRYGALRVTAWTLWIGTPALVVIGAPALADTELTAVPVWAWGCVAYAGIFAIAVADLLWYRGVRVLGKARTAVYSNLVPVAALATAFLWLGEVPTPLQLTGAGVILAGLALTRVRRPAGAVRA